MVARLTIKDFSQQVSLGCTASEQETLQEVLFTIHFPFNEPIPGERTDQLKDSLCYAEICELIETTLKGKKFQLIESMVFQVSENLKNNLPNHDFHIILQKVTPPIKGLKGGVFYESFNYTQ